MPPKYEEDVEMERILFIRGSWRIEFWGVPFEDALYFLGRGVQWDTGNRFWDLLWLRIWKKA